MMKRREHFLIIAQITDLHLRVDGTLFNGNRDTVAELATCVEHLNRMQPRPDVVLATGDLADVGTPDVYRKMRRMLDRIELPVYVIPGNHDDRDMLRTAFVDLGYLPTDGPFLQYTIEDYPLRLIGLDTVETGGDGGEMCAQRLEWLDARLGEQPARPTLIFMHHQPKLTRMGYRDHHAFRGAKEMETIVRRHPQIEWIVCGHLHRPIQMRWGGTTVSVAPSSAFQRTLTLDNAMPKAYVDEPTGLNVYLWEPQAGIICHTSLIGDFGTPYPMLDG